MYSHSNNRSDRSDNFSRDNSRSSSSRFGGAHRGGRSGFGGGGRRFGSRSGGGRGSRTQDYSRFIKKAKPVEEVVYNPAYSFEDSQLDSRLKATIAHKKFTHPTPIQEQTLDAALAGRDVLGIANTGTGKTGGFLIPIIHRLLTEPVKFSALVIVPTRELATQVEEEFMSLTRGLNLFSACCTGGSDIRRQIQRLRKPNQLIVGTPGRLMDLVDRGIIDLKSFSVLVLDEVDRMLDMGFVDDVRFIVDRIPTPRQTLFFSATIDRTIEPLVAELLVNPVKVMVASGHSTSDTIDQDIVRVPADKKKIDVLVELLQKPEFSRTLIFSQTKREVDNLYHDLRHAGVRVESIHGDKTQGARRIALDKFKHGVVDVLIATDVAARGLDIPSVSHVINYEIPQSHDDYVHRIGRTGRAGKTGSALTFVD